MIYREFEFNLNGINNINQSRYKEKFPVVYIIYNDKEAYIGQTTDLYIRMKKHFGDSSKKHLKKILIITDKTFNGSVIEDIEAQLIRCMSCDGRFKLVNRKRGTEDNYYYKKEDYEFIIDPIWKKIYEKGLANFNIKKIRNMSTYKLSPYTALIEEQYNIENNIVRKDIKKYDKISVFGLGGTGKTVLAIHIFKRLITENDELKIKFVVPTRTFRFTVKKVFDKTEGLNRNMVIAPNELKENKEYDILIVDEAHRLRRYKNLSSAKEYNKFRDICNNLGLDYKISNELDWIQKCSQKQIIFYDYNQRIKPTDIKRQDLEKYVDESKQYRLISQLRCQGGNDYISFVLDLLNCNIKENSIKEFGNYEIKIFDDLKVMKKEIGKKERRFGLCRTVSGISFKWDRKKNPKFKLGNIRERWNKNIEDWINSKNAIHELGCIHTIQGYDLNYCAIIFGKEIDYDKTNNRLVIDKTKYLDINGKNGEPYEEIRKSIINIYYAMMTRGIKGTYIYAINDNLREYMKKYVETFGQNIINNEELCSKAAEDNEEYGS